jgi:hypothetical protein
MKKTITLVLIFISTIFTFNSLSALPQAPLDMDNNYADWKGGTGGAATCFKDIDGVDDIPLRKADITEYCMHVDSAQSGGFYLLMAIDDTEPNKSDVRTVVDINGDRVPEYSVNNGLDYKKKDGLTTEGVSISACGDADCSLNKLILICKNGTANPCTNTTEGFNNNWPSQFTSSSCDGANCATLDGFIEIFVPWQWLGGTPPDSFLIGMYLSAHSGGTEDSSTNETGQGIACSDSGCFISGPTAVSLQSFSGLSNYDSDTESGIAFAFMMFLGGLSLLGWRFKLRNA